MKKNKAFLKLSLICGVASFLCFNLVSCNQTKKEFIEVGLEVDDHSAIETNPWLEFYTGLKAKTQKDKTQQIEVFYGNSRFLYSNLNKGYYESMNQKFEIDKSQVLEFKLTRYVYSNGEDSNYGRFEKSKEIFVKENTLGYFMSEEFRLEENSIIDTIELNDLVQDDDNYGILEYKFSITPIENEPIKIFIDDQPVPVYSENFIRSYYNSSIDYTIDDQNQITFIEREETRKENTNV